MTPPADLVMLSDMTGLAHVTRDRETVCGRALADLGMSSDGR